MVLGLGLRVKGLGVKVCDFEFLSLGLRFRVRDLGIRSWDLRFTVYNLEFGGQV